MTAMRHVLLNDWLLSSARTGVGQYLAALLAHWPSDANVGVVGFHSQKVLRRESIAVARFAFPPLASVDPIPLRPLSSILPPRQGSSLSPRGWAKTLGRLAYSAWLKREYRRGDYIGLFEPNGIPMIVADPTMTTIHDLSVLELPGLHPPNRVAYWERSLRSAIQRTAHWVSVSQATADAMTRLLNVPAERITVIPLASRLGPPPANWTPEAVRKQLRLPERYLLYLGSIEPRKNVTALLDAYAGRSEEWRRRTPLIIAGMPGWGSQSFWRSLREHPMAASVSMTGYLSDEQAAALLRGADALLYPSFYEGFGLPPLEAMGLEVPVVASTAASLREVCGSAAVLLDPQDVASWSEWMERLLEPGQERSLSIERGRTRANEFSWTRSAQRHHDLCVGLAKVA